MRILHTVEFYSPCLGGAQEVVRQLSRHMARQGHDVTVATSYLSERSKDVIEGVKIAPFKIKGRSATGMEGEIEKYQTFVRDGSFDVVMSYAAQQWATDALLDVLDTLPCAKVLSPCGFSGLHQPMFADYFRRMPGWLEGYDRLIFHTKNYRDIDFARKCGYESKSYIVPNGAGEDEFLEPPTDFRKKYQIPEDIPVILTIGSHTGVKGHAEAIRIFSKARIGKAVLLVVGNPIPGAGCYRQCQVQAMMASLLTLGKRKVQLYDLPRPDVVGAFNAADLFLFTSNIECSPLVLFEAAASGLPFLSADVGNSVEIAEWTQAGQIIPTRRDANSESHVDELIATRMLEEMIENKAMRDDLGQKGKNLWKKYFTWEKLVHNYLEVYQSAVESREPNLPDFVGQLEAEAMSIAGGGQL